MEEKCVYMWVNDTTHEPFYVGCGNISRAKDKHKNRTKAFEDIITTNKCHYVIIKRNLSIEEAAKLERQVIKDYREQGCDLVNQTNGGEIAHVGFWTDEMRKEYAKRLTGENNPNFGNRWSDDLKKRMSEKFKSEKSHAGGRNGRAKPVMCVETGVIYACKRDAGNAVNILNGDYKITVCIQNPKMTAGKGKYHFVGQDMFEELNTEEKRIEWLENIKAS